MSDGGGHVDDADSAVGSGASIDGLIDRAVAAINRGDRAAASALADQVLAVDGRNIDAEDLLAAPAVAGEMRRLSILFADLVDSTVLSTAVEPETYRLLVGRYRDLVAAAVTRLEGHIGSTKGDGLLAVFGHPVAHEDDVRRAVLAGLDITADIARLSAQAQRRFGIELNVRIGVHRGLVYLDTDQDDVYGLAANLAARVCGLAPPGTVVVSDAIAPLIGNTFELRALTPAAVKGVDELISHHQVLAEKVGPVKLGRGPLVGRDREVTRLKKSWSRAQAGTLTTPGVVFRGEPGIGKSRLAAAAAESVETSGAVVLELTGSPLHIDAGLYPVRTLLERRCGISRSTAPAERLRLLRAEVTTRGLDPATCVPLLAPVLGIAPEAGYASVAAEGRKLYELIGAGVADYLWACFADAPGLLIAEDLHWFDPSTLDVLGGVLDAAAGRLLVVITGRPGSWLESGWPVKVFDLVALTDQQTEELISALNPGLSAADRAAVVERCDGVPFYIEQVIGGLTETGVPEALYEPLFARLRASPTVVPVVHAAGVIGRHVERTLLCAVVDLSDDAVDDALDELEDALVLEPWGPDTWRFRHELLREVAAEIAPPSVLRTLHGKVADTLAWGGDPDWGLVAGHYQQAERYDDAADAYRQSAEAARRRGAAVEARSALTQALAQLDLAAPGPDRDRREMSARLARGLLTMSVEGPSSRATANDLEQCLQLGGTDLGDDELAATLTGLSGYYGTRADLRRFRQVIESLGAAEGRSGWFHAWTEGAFGAAAWLRGDFGAAETHFVAAGRAPASLDTGSVRLFPVDPTAGAQQHLAFAHLFRGDLTAAEAQLTNAERRVEQLDFPQGAWMLAYGRFINTWLQIETGRLDRAATVAAALIDGAERHGFELWQLWGATDNAIVSALTALGAHDLSGLATHIATLTTLLDTLRTAEVNMYRTFFDATLGRLLLAAGKPEQARTRLDTALAIAQDTGMHFYDAELLRIRAQTHTDPDARAADLAAALELARHQGATLFELRSALDDFELRGEPARATLVDVVARMPAGFAWPELARAKVIL